MAHLSEQEKTMLRELIQDVERQTDGEIVTVITPYSDSYAYLNAAWGLPTVLLTPLILHYWWGGISLLNLFNIQVLVFCVLWVLFQYWPIRRLFISKKSMHTAARRMAHELFFMQKLHYKTQRNAIMLFVSVAERYVEVLADKSIAEKVDSSTWKNVVEVFLAQVQAGKIAQGYCDAIERCGELLRQHFPLSGDSKDELPNHLIEWQWNKEDTL